MSFADLPAAARNAPWATNSPSSKTALVDTPGASPPAGWREVCSTVLSSRIAMAVGAAVLVTALLLPLCRRAPRNDYEPGGTATVPVLMGGLAAGVLVLAAPSMKAAVAWAQRAWRKGDAVPPRTF